MSSVPRDAQGVNRDEIKVALAPYFEHDAVVEIRAPSVGGKRNNTASGYFNDLEKAVVEVVKLDGKAPAIYFTLNPVNPALLARAVNHVKEWAPYTTADGDVTRRLRLPLDFDPQRPAGISSTDAEHDAALQRTHAAAAFLNGMGWPDPILADSGNGGHAVYQIDLPNDADSAKLVQQVLQTLARFFDDAPDAPIRVCLDTTVHNASRIWKVPGTLAKKGDSTPERPHRRAHVLSAPAAPTLVTREQLVALCKALGDEPEPPPRSERQNGARTNHRTENSPLHIADFGAYLDAHTIGYRETGKSAKTDARHFLLDACVWAGHADHAAWAYQMPNGNIATGCSHNSCSGKGLRDFRDAVEPGWHQGKTKERQTADGDGADDQQSEEDALAAARQIVDGLVEAAKADRGAPFDPSVLKALVVIRRADTAAWVRLREELRQVGVPLRELDKAILRAASVRGGQQEDGKASFNPGQSSRPVGGPYRVVNGAICLEKDTHDPLGPQAAVTVPLCNFQARVAAEEIHDDGAEQTTVLVVEGRLQSGETLPPVRIASDRYAGLAWVTANWGTRAVVYAGMSMKDHLRTAIQLLSGAPPRTTIYTHTGWREIDGEWAYLHGGGAIGASGVLDEVSVSLPGGLARFILPAPPGR
jgi:hypothetical protein